MTHFRRDQVDYTPHPNQGGALNQHRGDGAIQVVSAVCNCHHGPRATQTHQLIVFASLTKYIAMLSHKFLVLLHYVHWLYGIPAHCCFAALFSFSECDGTDRGIIFHFGSVAIFFSSKSIPTASRSSSKHALQHRLFVHNALHQDCANVCRRRLGQHPH